nr:hypothetical protein [Tanacetum cinerariifolium]
MNSIETSTLIREGEFNMLNPALDVGMVLIFETTSQLDVQTPTFVDPLPMNAPTMNPSTVATITTTSQAPILPTTVSSNIIQNLSNFGLLFRFDDMMRIVNQYMDQRMNEAVKVAVQIQSDRLRDEAQRENKEFLKTVDENMQKIIKELVKEQVKDEEPSAGPDRGSKRRREGKGPESASASTDAATRSTGRSTQGSRSRQASTSESALGEEPMQTTSQMEEPSHPEFDTGAEDQPIVQSSQHPEWFSQQQKPPTLDRAWNKTVSAVHGSIQPWISDLAKQADTRSSFNELMDTPLDFSNFLINRLKVDTLTLELLAGPTYELRKGSCKNLIELEYHLEEVFKATTDQLDYVNPEGQQYPHNLLKSLLLIPNNRGHRVIPFEHFINNDLEYLRGGASSRWHRYKHLDWITMRRDDDKLYKFKKGDFKRLRIQDIEDMLLILVQGKLTNLTVEERFAFNVSLRMFTRSIVIQRRVEDLQLGNKDKRNRLMRIDKLRKFSDGTLTDVRTALDDHLKGILMRYLPQSIWRKSDKDRAAAMIQAIEKRLKIRRIMSSLERFVGGRLYEGDLRMLQRTI